MKIVKLKSTLRRISHKRKLWIHVEAVVSPIANLMLVASEPVARTIGKGRGTYIIWHTVAEENWPRVKHVQKFQNYVVAYLNGHISEEKNKAKNVKKQRFFSSSALLSLIDTYAFGHTNHITKHLPFPYLVGANVLHITPWKKRAFAKVAKAVYPCFGDTSFCGGLRVVEASHSSWVTLQLGVTSGPEVRDCGRKDCFRRYTRQLAKLMFFWIHQAKERILITSVLPFEKNVWPRQVNEGQTWITDEGYNISWRCACHIRETVNKAPSQARLGTSHHLARSSSSQT